MAVDRPVAVKVDASEFKALFSPKLETLASLFKEYGCGLRIASGAVRDLLTKIQIKDLGFATTATPDLIEWKLCSFCFNRVMYLIYYMLLIRKVIISMCGHFHFTNSIYQPVKLFRKERTTLNGRTVC